MPGSKYERELRFIDTEVRRLRGQLQNMAEFVPADPAEAAKKAEQVDQIEVRISELLARKKEIEDSFIECGLDVPDISRNLNANTCRDNAQYDSTVEAKEGDGSKPKSGLDDLGEEISSITAEINELEVLLMKAELDDTGEAPKLRMSINALRDRREDLIHEMKEARTAPKEEPKADDATSRRLDALEADNRAIRSQLSGVRSDMMDIKEQLRELLQALGREDDRFGGRSWTSCPRPSRPRTWGRPRRTRPSRSAPWRVSHRNRSSR
ncbi:MAG: hypothetical protein E7Z69_00110 [Thermoplasmata archaeon]|nr:hypothetical protein [Thermoplasmata archaeon]